MDEWSIVLTVLSVIIALTSLITSFAFSLRKEKAKSNEKENDHIMFMTNVNDTMKRIDVSITKLDVKVDDINTKIGEIYTKLTEHEMKIKHLEKEVFHNK